MRAKVNDFSNFNEYTDDQMDIDYAWKNSHKNNNNFNNNNNNNRNNKLLSKKGNFNKDPNNNNRFNNKYSEISERNGYFTREYRYNPRKPKGIYNKYYKKDIENYKYKCKEKYY